VSKLIYKRLQKVLYKVIDIKKSTFLKGRRLLDSVIVTNEVIDEEKNNKECIIAKIYFEKAFDSIKWDFLCYMIERLDFSYSRIKWIRNCLESSHVSIIKDNPTCECKMEKGLRQCDSLESSHVSIIKDNPTCECKMEKGLRQCDSLAPFSISHH